jgi:serine/threonine protein kinase
MFISEAKIRNIIYQITYGIKYMHLNNIMHRDLKPENILIILNDNLVKNADFGTAKEIPD